MGRIFHRPIQDRAAPADRDGSLVPVKLTKTTKTA